MITLKSDEAREFLVGHHGLRSFEGRAGAAGVRETLARMRCIQLDPLDVIGTNADLVALARVDGIARGDVYKHLLPRYAFEHFAKERCLLPADAFPWYRIRMAETPWWRLSERLKRLDTKVIDAVLAEIKERGPLGADDLFNHGKVQPLDWNGWKGTSRASSMALEVLWTQCRIVVAGRARGRKLYDVPERALPKLKPPRGTFERWALLERVEAAGLMSRNSGPVWSMLTHARTSDLPQALIDEGAIEEVAVAGSPRRYLAPKGFRERRWAKDDGRMRILGPLDPVIWDRQLVQSAFGFEYVWEVYKPESQRKWGWYVCPLLHRGRLVGRIQARVDRTKKTPRLLVEKLWKEKGREFDREAYDETMQRHARALGASIPASRSRAS